MRLLIHWLATGWEATDGNKRWAGIALVAAGLCGHHAQLLSSEDAKLTLGAGITMLGIGALHGGHKIKQSQQERDEDERTEVS